jgi:LytS/YehU family sensor histidine kinase
LTNIRERLQLLYGHKAQVKITENHPSGTVVTLTVPYLSSAQGRDERDDQPAQGAPA